MCFPCLILALVEGNPSSPLPATLYLMNFKPLLTLFLLHHTTKSNENFVLLDDF